MSYKLSQPTYDLTDSTNMRTLLHYYSINVAVSIVTMLIIVLVSGVLGSGLIGHAAVFVVILMSQLFAVTTLKYYEGCYQKIE